MKVDREEVKNAILIFMYDKKISEENTINAEVISNKLHINNNLIIELLSELENEGLIDSIFDSRLN